jgi:DNA mismatch repair protein MutS2
MAAEAGGFERLVAKARADLGWDDLRAELAARAHTDRGTALARALEPSLDLGWIRTRMAEIGEARGLHDTTEAMPFGAITDVEAALARAEKGGHLDGPSLRAIAEVLRASAFMRRHLTQRGQRVPRLAGRAMVLAPLDDVRGPIEDAFDDGGVLRDTASPALGGLRKRAAVLHEELGRKSRALLDDPQVAPHLQDHFYTQREDRYVLPIRADARTRVRGIVHGISASGQTVFVEPEGIVDLNNRLKLAELEVADEERRILGELTLLVTDALVPIRVNLEVLAELDLIDAGARLALACAARDVALYDGEAQGARVDLRNARHPLMVLAGKRCVPNDIVLERGGTLVISGPNAGGKTVALKTLGLLSLMARAGLHVPAQEGSSLPLFETVLTDVGDDQSIERNLSTFSAHVLNLNAFLKAAGPGTLLLLDEVAVGTDPEQGAALAQAVLERLAERGATVIVTTHYDRLKALGARDPRFTNASVGFDLTELAPTYKLHIGVPGASGAIVVAKRLGLPEEVASRADELLGRRQQGIEELLHQVDAERRRLMDQVTAAEAEREQAAAERRRAEQLTEEAAARLKEARRAAHDEALDALKGARLEFERVRGELKRAQAETRQETLAQAERDLDRAAAELRRHATPSPLAGGRPPTPEELMIGAEVLVPNMGGRGVIAALPTVGKAVVQMGVLKVTVPVDELRMPPHARGEDKGRGPGGGGGAARAGARVAAGAAPATVRTTGNTLDLRGERVDAALALAEKFVDDGLRGGVDAVFLVHGHGTGALRGALRDHFTHFPGVRTLRSGSPEEGGDGVTVLLLG